MGLIRNAIGSALGANDVKNGFNGPQLPFKKKNLQCQQTTVLNDCQSPNVEPRSRPKTPRYHQSLSASHPDLKASRLGSSPNVDVASQRSRYSSSNLLDVQSRSHDLNLAYAQYSLGKADPRLEQDTGPINYHASEDGLTLQQGNLNQTAASTHSSYRPVALPQVAFGDGQPFLRGYSLELQKYGISKTTFIEAVDAINAAIIPNPEMQIFQKGANIAGWFLPGAASAGLMAGQIVLGVGGAFGHVALINKVLAKVNLDTFVSKGLEICIGTSSDLDKEVGRQQSMLAQYQSSSNEKLASYDQLIAPLDEILGQAQVDGRRDPIALLGKGIGRRTDQRKMQKAQKKLAKGKTEKMDGIEGQLKWLIVRKASGEAINEWQKVLQQSSNDLASVQS